MAEKLKIIPLGGLDEIGKNCTVLEYGKDMIVIDCGVGFPEEDMYGVDLVIPDFTKACTEKCCCVCILIHCKCILKGLVLICEIYYIVI